MKRFILFSSSLFSAVLLMGTEKCDKPNIVILLFDDLGYSDVGFSGSTHIETPNIDKLCRQGMRLNHCYAASGVSSPSRAALLTGQYPRKLGIDYALLGSECSYLPARYVTIPKKLKEAGYETIHIGKWHLGGIDTPEEFDARAQGKKISDGPLEHGFDHALVMLENIDLRMHLTNHGGIYSKGTRYLYDDNTKLPPINEHWTSYKGDQAAKYILNKKNNKPFFLNVWFDVPHTPIEAAPEPYYSTYVKRYGDNDRAKYCSMIAHADAQVGKIVAALQARSLMENTIIIMLSDNGATRKQFSDSNLPFKGGKWSLYEGGILTPSFIVWQRAIAPNIESNARIHQVDILPTICDLAGVNLSKEERNQLDGISLRLHLLSGKALPQRDLFFTAGNSHVIITNNEKIGYFNTQYNEPTQLEAYTLQTTPKEEVEVNVADRQVMLDKLKQYIDRPRHSLEKPQFKQTFDWKLWMNKTDSVAFVNALVYD